MRERRPEDWRTDLVQRHELEAEVAKVLNDHPDLVLLTDSTASVNSLDYQLEGPGGLRLEVELKAKRQPYVGWSAFRPDVAERDLFILDELSLRHIVDAGRYAFLLVNDVPGRRWCLWATPDLVLASKVRVARPLMRKKARSKGKVLLDIVEQALVVETMVEAVDAIAATTPAIDLHWHDVAPWPRLTKEGRA
jgi:hypothetical protein